MKEYEKKAKGESTDHFDDFYLGLNPKVVKELLQVLLHLYGVVLHLGDSEDLHFAILPGAVLLEEEGQQHEKTAVMHNPPDVDVADDFLG
jgi:hypothetical protein